MTAATIIQQAAADGVALAATSDGKLKLKGRTQAIVRWRPIVIQHKEELLAALRQPDKSSWADADWLAFFHERAAIGEFDNHLPRHRAEALAFETCVVEWLDRNHAATEPGRCAHCGGDGRGHDQLLSYGTNESGHAWLHGGCWSAWFGARKAEAVVALAAMGIPDTRCAPVVSGDPIALEVPF